MKTKKELAVGAASLNNKSLVLIASLVNYTIPDTIFSEVENE